MGNKIRRPSPYITFLLAGFISGSLISLLLITVLISYRIDIFHQRIEYLEAELEAKQNQLTSLNDSINKSKYVLKEIEIIFISEVDAAEQVILKKSIKQKLKPILGKNINEIDTNILVEIIDKRILITDSCEYKLQLERLVLSGTLRIWINAVKMDLPVQAYKIPIDTIAYIYGLANS